MRDITIFRAKCIRTMDPNRPSATHVAVAEGRILAVGDSDCAEPWGSGRVDGRYSDCVLMPGFVEGHAHLLAGGLWQYPYIGFHDIPGPDGAVLRGLKSVDAVISALREALAGLASDAPLFAWGFDPIFLDGDRLNRRHLDQVAADRPILILHSNGHVTTVNSHALDMVGYDANTDVEGIIRFDDGTPTGELAELAAQFPIQRRLELDLFALSQTDDALRNYAGIARSVGVTTAADLLAALPEERMDSLVSITRAEEFPIRLVPALEGIRTSAEEVISRMPSLRKQSHDKLRIGAVKLMSDGSIQGYSSRMHWPGHITGAANGIWNNPPEQFAAKVAALHAAGIQLHIHVNGDEASELAIDAIQAALESHPRFDHRHTLQHCQMAGEAQFRRMSALGIGVNLFANHLWYFGDAHYEATIGPDRAMRMDACRSALANRVPLTIHSDAPVTPMNPLFTAWCAANRKTPKGRVLGEYQKLTLQEALHAITLGGAYSLNMDAEVGSIETGKRADFAVLQSDPIEQGAEGLKDVKVLSTVLSGQPTSP